MANNSSEENRIKSAMTGSVTGFAAKTALANENVAPEPINISDNQSNSPSVKIENHIGEDWNDSYEIDESRKASFAEKIMSYINKVLPKPIPKNNEKKEKGASQTMQQAAIVEAPVVQNSIQPVINTTKKIPEKTNTSVVKTMRPKKLFKTCFALIATLFACILIVLVLSYLNIDTKIMKLTLSGTITDERTNEPISQVQIIINNEVVGLSNENGTYEIKNLDVESIEIKFVAENYYEKIENLELDHAVLEYNVKKDITLKSSLIGTLSGSFSTVQEDHKFAEDTLEIENERVTLNSDGSFLAEDVPVGKVTLKFTSLYYKDITKVLNLDPGTNNLETISLENAGDIEGDALSYIREDVVLGTKFLIENVVENQISIENDGKFLIKDLEVGRTYKIRVTAEGYETRDYSIDIKQGINQLFDFKLVEVGNAVFTKIIESSGSNDTQLFSSSFDGMNLSELTDINNFDLGELYYDETSNLAYFSSDHAKNRGVLRNYIFLPYTINLETKEITKIFSASTNDVGFLYPNFQAQKIANVTSPSSNSKQRYLKVSNLDGTSSKQLRAINAGEFSQIAISDNGEYVFFYEKDQSKNQNGFYRINIETSKVDERLEIEEFSLFDISSNGSRIIFSARKESSGFLDLFMADYSTGEIRTLIRNYDGKNYQFKSGSEDILLFYANREGINNIYSYSIDKNKDSRITSLTSDVKISEVYQQGKFIFYKTDKGLFVLDFDKPKSGKNVVSLE
jgi:hypothetical protein